MAPGLCLFVVWLTYLEYTMHTHTGALLDHLSAGWEKEGSVAL